MEPQKTTKNVRKETPRKAGPSANKKDYDRSYQQIMFVALNACVRRDDLIYALTCPVQLSVGDQVWAVDFNLLTGEEIRRTPGIITRVPDGRNRKGKQYMVRFSFYPYSEGLWPAGWIDYVAPYESFFPSEEGAAPC